MAFHGPDPENKPWVKLVGQDGNAFSVIGRCVGAAKKAGWTKAQIEALKTDMTSGDYDRLLFVALQNFNEGDPNEQEVEEEEDLEYEDEEEEEDE